MLERLLFDWSKAAGPQTSQKYFDLLKENVDSFTMVLPFLRAKRFDAVTYIAQEVLDAPRRHSLDDDKDQIRFALTVAYRLTSPFHRSFLCSLGSRTHTFLCLLDSPDDLKKLPLISTREKHNLHAESFHPIGKNCIWATGARVR